MLKRLATFPLLGAAAIFAAPASAEMKPASQAEIEAATEQCLAAATADGIDEEAIERAGWEGATTSRDDEPITTPLSFYGKRGGNAMIMLPHGAGDTGDKVCFVMARIDKLDDYSALIAAMSASFGEPKISKGNERTWFASNKLIQIDATGSRKKPSVRIAVMQVPGDK